MSTEALALKIKKNEVDEIFRQLFVSLDDKSKGYIHKHILMDICLKRGIKQDDSRIKEIFEKLRKYTCNHKISLDDFVSLTENHIGIIERIIKGNMIIPDFENFAKEIKNIYDKTITDISGHVADYIPQLARVHPEHYAISICTIDGQRLDIGHAYTPYSVQSTCKPINYCIALELNGEKKVHHHVGREPSGRGFNEIALNKQNKPHNPLINAGAIMCSSLIKPEESLADRFDYVMDIWRKLSGGVKANFNNSVYHSEKATADRNFALAHFMREVKAFPENTDIHETLDFYFQSCSIEVTAHDMATIAASFANAGTCPVTDTKVFSSDTVKNCLSLMYSCGMYDFSGEFAFTMGVPAKSGVSGALMIVIPNVMGIAVWSPCLDSMGNSVRGVNFCKELVDKFNFHNYDSLVGQTQKIDPRLKKNEADVNKTFTLIWAASKGDIDEIKRMIALGVDLDQGDYDGRNALHLAASEGKFDVVTFLINKGVNISPKDRWGNTPLIDAKRHNHKEIVTFLESLTEKK